MKLSTFFDRLTECVNNNTNVELTPSEAATIRDVLDQLTDDFENVVNGNARPCDVCGNADACDDPFGNAYGCRYWLSRSFREG